MPHGNVFENKWKYAETWHKSCLNPDSVGAWAWFRTNWIVLPAIFSLNWSCDCERNSNGISLCWVWHKKCSLLLCVGWKSNCEPVLPDCQYCQSPIAMHASVACFCARSKNQTLLSWGKNCLYFFFSLYKTKLPSGTHTYRVWASQVAAFNLLSI